MNKPPIKQKPTIKPRPPVKPKFDLKPKLDASNDLKPKLDASNDLKLSQLKLDESNESLSTSQTTKSNEFTFSQKVLDKQQLNKAFQLLNQSSLPEKEDAQYDIRVDEDQIETCNQIINILLKSGYLRANIIGLSEFDKVRARSMCDDSCEGFM